MAKPLSFPLQGFKQGLMTLGRAWETPPDALRVCSNFDVTRTGQLVRRQGRVRFHEGTVIAGTLYGRDDELYFVDSGSLRVLTPNGITTLATVGGGAMAYADSAGVLYYSNGRITGRIINGAATHWGLPIPAQQPALVYETAGSLPPGTYQVAITYISILPNGAEEESGTGLAAEITLTETGGIVANAIPSGGNDYFNLYVSHANGAALFLYGTYAAAMADGVRITSDPTGPELETQFHAPPPSGTVLCAHSARLLVGSGSVVYLTEPFYPSLVDYRESILPYDAPITLLHPVRDGVYVGTATDLWFITGLDAQELQQLRVGRYGITPGTGVALPQTAHGAMAWSDRGILALGDSGQVKLMMEPSIALDGTPYLDGVAGYREARPSKQRTAIFILRPGTRYQPTLVFATTVESWTAGQTATVSGQSALTVAASLATSRTAGRQAIVQTGGLIATRATSQTVPYPATVAQHTLIDATPATTETTGLASTLRQDANILHNFGDRYEALSVVTGLDADVNAQNYLTATLATSQTSGKTATISALYISPFFATLATTGTAGITATVNAVRAIAGTLATSETAGLAGGVSQAKIVEGTLAAAETAGLAATVTAIANYAIAGTLAASETAAYAAAVNGQVQIVATLGTTETAGQVAAVNAQTMVAATLATSESTPLAGAVNNYVHPVATLGVSQVVGLTATVSQAKAINATLASTETAGLTGTVNSNRFVSITATVACSEMVPLQATVDHLFGRATADGDTRVTADNDRRVVI